MEGTPRTLSVTSVAALFRAVGAGAISEERRRGSKETHRARAGRAIALSQSACPGSVMKRVGVRRESAGVERYAKEYGVCVQHRNSTTKTLTIGDARVVGRPDGIVQDQRIVVEHKYRVRKLLDYVPLHERVQCHLYMRMFDLRRAHLIETFGDSMKVHEVRFDQALWQRVEDAIIRSTACSPN